MTEEPFVAHRSLLFTVACEMLGSAADAEDVLREAWPRRANVDDSQVRDPRAYLIRVVTRQALNQMRTSSRRREEYVGEWLPDVRRDRRGDREVRGRVRQIARRAREHLAARRPRVQVSRSEQQAVVERFLVALRTGQLQALMGVMAPDVVLIADGGGLVAGVRSPIYGAERVARLLARANRVATLETTAVWLNGAPAGRIDFGRRGERRRGGGARLPDLCDAKPAEAGTVGRDGRTRPLSPPLWR